MDRSSFYQYVESLREGIVKGWSTTFQHKQLDKIIEITEGDKMDNQISLENDVKRIIKRIKKSSELC